MAVAGAPGVGHGINSINNNNVVMQGVKGQPSNVGVGGDGITTVSINPTMNSSAGSDVEPGTHGIHLTGEGQFVHNKSCALLLFRKSVSACHYY